MKQGKTGLQRVQDSKEQRQHWNLQMLGQVVQVYMLQKMPELWNARVCLLLKTCRWAKTLSSAWVEKLWSQRSKALMSFATATAVAIGMISGTVEGCSVKSPTATKCSVSAALSCFSERDCQARGVRTDKRAVHRVWNDFWVDKRGRRTHWVHKHWLKKEKDEREVTWPGHWKNLGCKRISSVSKKSTSLKNQILTSKCHTWRKIQTPTILTTSSTATGSTRCQKRRKQLSWITLRS